MKTEKKSLLDKIAEKTGMGWEYYWLAVFAYIAMC